MGIYISQGILGVLSMMDDGLEGEGEGGVDGETSWMFYKRECFGIILMYWFSGVQFWEIVSQVGGK